MHCLGLLDGQCSALWQHVQVFAACHCANDDCCSVWSHKTSDKRWPGTDNVYQWIYWSAKRYAVLIQVLFYSRWCCGVCQRWYYWAHCSQVVITLQFLPLHAAIAMERWCRRLMSVRLSVCPSVTLVIPDHIRWGRWNFITRLISAMSSLAARKISAI